MSGRAQRQLRDAIRNVVEASEAITDQARNVVVARNIGGSNRSHSVSVRQHVVHRGDRVTIEEERAERRDG